TNPAMQFSSVVLPQPDGPSRQTNSPSSTCNDTFWSASIRRSGPRPANATPSSEIVILGWPTLQPPCALVWRRPDLRVARGLRSVARRPEQHAAGWLTAPVLLARIYLMAAQPRGLNHCGDLHALVRREARHAVKTRRLDAVAGVEVHNGHVTVAAGLQCALLGV